MQTGSAVILVDAHGRVLLQQRDDEVPPAGYGRWAIPGGGREGDETPLETARREFEEETGVRLALLRPFATFERDDVPGMTQDVVVVFAAADAVDEAAIDVREGLAFRFWAQEEIAGLAMNPGTRRVLEAFFGSDAYRTALAERQAITARAMVIEIDRWGRLLLMQRPSPGGAWMVPAGFVRPGESPDAAALRIFEEETGHLLEDLRLFHVFREGEVPGLAGVEHVYAIDADIDEGLIEAPPGRAFRYVRPADAAALPLRPHDRAIVEQFVASTHYRKMFH